MQFAVYLPKQKVQDEEIARLHLNVVFFCFVLCFFSCYHSPYLFFLLPFCFLS